VCPLWTATTGNWVGGAPAIANGVVYVGSDDDHLYAFDVAGTTNCSGTPKTCSPLWKAATGGDVGGGPIDQPHAHASLSTNSLANR
jgi:outer membrane protein assembly factor BamB